MKNLILSLFCLTAFHLVTAQHNVVDAHGAIVRGDSTKKYIAIVFTADEFGEGGDTILNTFQKHQVRASFFLTGNFYRNSAFKKWIESALKNGHYLGPHSDKHLLYATWENRDSLLVNKQEFIKDLRQNMKQMKNFGIDHQRSSYFLPPYEWYNKTISNWTRDLNMTLINFTPGTRTASDYTYPEIGSAYLSSDSIYQSIWKLEKHSKNGLNGFIILIHLGTDPRRTDKFYNRLDNLLIELKKRGYQPVRVDELLDSYPRPYMRATSFTIFSISSSSPRGS